jgi:hypothetical protein
MIKKFYLVPADNRKSFYNKCYVQQIGNEATLYSYDTKIVTYNTLTGEITKTSYYDYSMTTKRHQKAFFNYYGIEA